MHQARIIADSINPLGVRLTTAELTYPLIIHAEFMTHRMFSRNAASSRAIPIEKKMDGVRQHGDHVIAQWGSNNKGMVSNAPLEDVAELECRRIWHDAKKEALYYCGRMKDTGAHKQVANRLLAPFDHITVVATGTNDCWANMFNQRCHPAADPTFMSLAYDAFDEYIKSTPREIGWGDWHIPYDERDSLFGTSLSDRVKIATGRIARVSYVQQNGQRDEKEDIELHDRLLESKHWSPFEHCAVAHETPLAWDNRRGNFGAHWLQYRKTFEGENQTVLDVETIINRKPIWLTL